MLTRRQAVAAGVATLALPAVAARPGSGLERDIAGLERRLGPGARIGFRLVDPVSGIGAAYRTDERFPMCSTFKLLLVACVLHRVDRGRERLDRELAIPAAKDLLPFSPVTSDHVGRSLPIRDLCAGAMTRSDNSAANLLLDAVGGPAALTRWLRATGDTVTRLDRTETSLNEGIPGDPRDTTSPAAMLETMRRLAFGTTLRPASRQQLLFWLTNNRTGDEKLRKRMPTGWTVGDRTGAGGHGSNNDVALIWPPNRAPRRPIFASVFITGGTNDDALARNWVHARIGELIVSAVEAS